MKKVLFSLLFAGALMAGGCGSNDKKTVGNSTENEIPKKQEQQKTTTSKEKPEKVSDKETQATTELCSCVNSYLADMSPSVRRIIIDVGKSDNPVQALTMELQKVHSAEEEQRLTRELERFGNDQQLQRCSENVMKKYNLDENNRQSREKVMKAASENKECEVVYSLMRIATEQEKMMEQMKKQQR